MIVFLCQEKIVLKNWGVNNIPSMEEQKNSPLPTDKRSSKEKG